MDQRYSEIIAPLILSWPSPRPPPLGILETILLRVPNPKPCQLEILKMNPPKKFKTSPHTSRTHICRGPRETPLIRAGSEGFYPSHRCQCVQRFQRVIMPLSVSNPREKFQETSDCLNNLCVEETNMDSASKATLERVLCIWYPTTFPEKFVSTQEVRSMPYTLALRNWASGSDQALFGCFLISERRKSTTPRWIFMEW